MGTIILSIEPTRKIMGQQPSSPPIFTTLTQHFEEGKKAIGKRVKAITKKVKSCHKETKKQPQRNKKAATRKQKKRRTAITQCAVWLIHLTSQAGRSAASGAV